METKFNEYELIMLMEACTMMGDFLKNMGNDLKGKYSIHEQFYDRAEEYYALGIKVNELV